MRVRVTASNKHPGWLLYAALLFGAVMLPYFFIVSFHHHSQLQSHGAGAGRQQTLITAPAARVKPAAAAVQYAEQVAPGCHCRESAEYPGGSVVVWGSNNLQPSAADCCKHCRETAGCNVWVWCAAADGCGNGRAHKECWLKKEELKAVLDFEAFTSPTIPWTSGALYSDADRDALLSAEARRLQTLKADKSLPLVFFDVEIKGKPVGRIQFVLFVKEAPRAAENFRQLCTGEHGKTSSGKPYHFKGASFYRIIDRFIDQAGIETDSVFGGMFQDDEGGLKLRHDRKGLLSMANGGPNTNTAHFSIMMAPAPHLNSHYTIFGEVVEGFEVAEAINALSRGKKDNTATREDGAVIVNSGQIR